MVDDVGSGSSRAQRPSVALQHQRQHRRSIFVSCSGRARCSHNCESNTALLAMVDCSFSTNKSKRMPLYIHVKGL